MIWSLEFMLENTVLKSVYTYAGLYWLLKMQLNFDSDEIQSLITDYLDAIMLCNWLNPIPNLFI